MGNLIMKTTIIIPNYNGRKFLRPCIEALKQQTSHDFQVLIVDNGSTDGSVPFLAATYPEVGVLTLKKNYGFARAVNEGIRVCNTPYVLLLNNDTIVEENFVAELVATIEDSEDIFAVGSKMLQMKNPELIDSACDCYTIMGWAIQRGVGRPFTEYEKKGNIFSACAGAALYRVSVLKKIGNFDESFFAYLEDIDISYRAMFFGYRCVYCPTAIVYHAGSGTTGSKYNSFKVRLSARNNRYVIYKNMPLWQRILNAAPLAIGHAIKYWFFKKKGFLDDYKAGVREAKKNRMNYIGILDEHQSLSVCLKIEGLLILGFFTYVRDFFSRKIESKAMAETSEELPKEKSVH
jgi:GT2 family glycosyltransferase